MAAAIGCFSDEGRKYENQDVFLEVTINETTQLLAVFDGHGVNGKLVSEFVKTHFMEIFLETSAFKKGKYESALKKTFLEVDALLAKSDIDIDFSGSTGTVVLLVGGKIVCAWAGDSRAVLFRQENFEFQPVVLSKDHNCANVDEVIRLRKHGSRIEPATRNGKYRGPMRFWKGSENYPGQCVTRSFGDKIAKTIGLLTEPEVMTRKLARSDQLVVIASDGFWDSLTTQSVASVLDMITTQKSPQMAASLVHTALKAAEKQGRTDNITVAIMNLETVTAPANASATFPVSFFKKIMNRSSS